MDPFGILTFIVGVFVAINMEFRIAQIMNGLTFCLQKFIFAPLG